MLRNGYWFNLDSLEWEVKMFPPNNVYVTEADSLYSFRGMPTIFGSPVCNSEGDCEYTEVMQYDNDDDEWNSLGYLLESRSFQAVIEVPQSVCDLIEPPTTEAPTTMSTTQETTGQFFPDPLLEFDSNSVAMIIGGAWGDATRQTTMASVELFGCPGFEGRSFPLDDYPLGTYLSGGTYFPNNQEVGKVIVCGGFLCTDPGSEIGGPFCNLGGDCYEWTVEEQWQEAPPLNDWKWSSLMALVVNLDNTDAPLDLSNERVPMIIGQNEQTEIYNVSTKEWTSYRQVPGVTEDWISANCLIQIGDFIYHIGNQFYELDTLEWEISRQTTVPDFLQMPGMCSWARVDDVNGKKFIRSLSFFMHF